MKPMEPPVPTEHQEQVDFFNQVRCLLPRMPELGLMFAVPNGEKRSISVAKRLKAEGVKPGVPDIVLPLARGPFHGLYIEMKRKPYRNGKGKLVKPKARPEQEYYIDQLRGQGYLAVVCIGADDAFGVLNEYLGFGPFGGVDK